MINARAIAFKEEAESAGWSVSMEDSGERQTLELSNPENGMFICVVWDSGRFIYDEAFQEHDGVRKTVRNASAARKIVGGSAPAGKVRTKRVPRADCAPLVRDWDAESGPIRPVAKRLPFKISQPDRVILAAVIGKEISWWNEKSRRVESSRVMCTDDQRHLRIIEAKGRRILCWAGDCEGFRSVYIDNIVEVSP